MKYEVLAPLKAKAEHGEIALRPGQQIILAPEKALKLVEGGKLKPVSDHQPSKQSVENMTLKDFSRSGLAVKVDSSLLGETVLFVSDETVAEKVKEAGFTCYSARELAWLTRKQPAPDVLRKIHEVKTVFPGSTILQ